VDATPFLVEVGRALREVRLEAVLIGNAAAALQGAPVTTVGALCRNCGKLVLSVKVPRTSL
jgi:hypothetical protein